MKIVNIVALAITNNLFDLKYISTKMNNTEFASFGANWLKMRLKPENYYISFYKSGRFLITGVRNIKTIHNIAKRIVIKLMNIGINVTIKDITIQNIVLTAKIELRQSLENIIISSNNLKMSYEPELFPGLIYKDDKNITYLLFSNGKLIITGVHSVQLAHEGLDNFKHMLGS